MMYSLLKEKKNCQVCNKTFANGKALAGHMRSHSRKLSAESSTVSITPALRPCSTRAQKFRSLETILMRCALASEAVGGPKPDLEKEGAQQVPAETKIVVDLEEVNSIESQCGITIEECALCLLKISEDQRTETLESLRSIYSLVSSRKRKEIEYIEIDSEEDHEDSDKFVDEDRDVEFYTPEVGNKDDEADGDYGDENAYFGTREKKCKKQSKYVCDICGKVLRSYQALGGHRTSHRNKRLKMSDNTNPENGPVVRRQYKCDICDKVFESGQALGGHRKVHYQFLQPTK
ncbi:Zinc finger protein ZAT4 [Cardamine amara subsp. amara]|uniref:Zinc finger protein ZAT4 n=1 Tax=Cardamine amara subsp. amara TaxID=228776 RepID=A0ABD1BDK9_CARAN